MQRGNHEWDRIWNAVQELLQRNNLNLKNPQYKNRVLKKSHRLNANYLPNTIILLRVFNELGMLQTIQDVSTEQGYHIKIVSSDLHHPSCKPVPPSDTTRHRLFTLFGLCSRT